MDAIVGVWLSSVVGAAAFCAAGYVLGQQTQSSEPEKKKKKKRKTDDPPSAPNLVAGVSVKTPDPAISIKPEPAPTSERPKDQNTAITTPPADPGDDIRPSTKNTAFPPAPRPPSFVDEEEEGTDRPTVVPAMATQDAILQSAAATIPPPQRAPSIPLPAMAMRMGSGSFDHDAHEATRQMIRDALTQVEQAAEQTRVLQLEKADLQRLLDAKTKELKDEIVLRAAAEARTLELSDRLASASEESSSLRHRVNMLDRQAKLLRESLKTSGGEDNRRRDLEEAEAMRVKLRDVVSKLERASLPPPSANGPVSQSSQSNRITLPPPSEQTPPRSIPGAPNVPRSLQPQTDDSGILREEIHRLAQENRALRAQTLGSLPPKPKQRRGSAPEIDLDRYRAVMERLGSVAGLRGAVLADEVGSLVIGTGDLAESLAAFGAYIRDSASRTDRLLPLEGVEEVDIKDRAGMLLSTRVVVHDPMELSLVFLASADPSFVAAKKIIEEQLRL